MTDFAELRDRLLQQRRDRLGRIGNLGPTIKALYRMAALAEASPMTIHRGGRMRVDYHLIMRVGLGSLMWRDRRTGRWEIASVRTHRAEYAAATTLIDDVIDALGPQYDGMSLTDLKAITDRLATEAMAGLAADPTCTSRETR
ncbi:hypothetical protein ACFV6B_13100 [Streptomyces microflavus]|uniref:hypothetical protein n=1 Tax=Streptomyces microflavus TaxID=1919 RepID=UPI0036565E88